MLFKNMLKDVLRDTSILIVSWFDGLTMTTFGMSIKTVIHVNEILRLKLVQAPPYVILNLRLSS
ncbi:hypothetical protein COV83_06880 [Candidatus Peregrinibacteria bacterium CG11_big_fil_rev_8_21_14_0_20_49_14]|nr:MAG: hypothetical protein COV83_06880 [Candidatus Peregrinibacteria bacterium CG11_big_fil_rev_8_21_14_0_20_49_14]